MGGSGARSAYTRKLQALERGDAANHSPAPRSPDNRLSALYASFRTSEKNTGVPWQVQAAQWAVETGWGTGSPKDINSGQESYNIFGVKATGTAASVRAWTWEVENGKRVDKIEAFRAYNSYAESIIDHAHLLATDSNYADARACGQAVKCWVDNLTPYATDPIYTEKLWTIITGYGWDN